ncbi:regulatory protein RecX [Aureisphaera galaxeae]|uniref:regulatory protein RecX n=1 Tax=Aureisphaera galaxeae TaxID=1538023 RepID=UPI002350281E|nr:regulatory protein RecX [Aureisphaera galaxeae]MDC8002708.1 regulatory protein RecX [Aureisphaera galaxeae]
MEKHKTYTVTEAKRRLQRYCAYQERCHKEVVSKLREMRMIPDAIDLIVHNLITEGYLNETRFAQSFARGKFHTKKWGRNRIVRELKLRDISKYNITIALKEISESEYTATFHQLAEKRWEQLKGETAILRKKKKLVDYLLYRGWESSWVWEKANELSQ